MLGQGLTKSLEFRKRVLIGGKATNIAISRFLSTFYESVVIKLEWRCYKLRSSDLRHFLQNRLYFFLEEFSTCAQIPL